MQTLSAIEYHSASDVFAGAKAARQRLMNAIPWQPPKPIVRMLPPADIIPTCAPVDYFEAYQRSTQEPIVLDGDERYLPKTAASYLRNRCMELGVSLSEIRGWRRTRPVVNIRTMLISEVYVNFPLLSLTQIGIVFMKDHTSILAAVRRYGVYRGKNETIAKS
jgi:hypothetical protein